MTPTSIIRDLLETYIDARDPLFASGGGGEGLSPQMTNEWHSGSYKELEVALKEMRAGQPEYSGVPLRELWWHTAQRYLMGERKVVWKVGERDVESLVRRMRCICNYYFASTSKARKHIFKAHKPQPHITMRYTAEYQRKLRDMPLRCELCEALAVRWLEGWFQDHNITPRLHAESLRERSGDGRR
jgi:hypothetical protein